MRIRSRDRERPTLFVSMGSSTAGLLTAGCVVVLQIISSVGFEALGEQAVSSSEARLKEAAVSANELPLNIAVEIEMVVEVAQIPNCLKR